LGKNNVVSGVAEKKKKFAGTPTRTFLLNPAYNIKKLPGNVIKINKIVIKNTVIVICSLLFLIFNSVLMATIAALL
jgi:hypothetical protein